MALAAAQWAVEQWALAGLLKVALPLAGLGVGAPAGQVGGGATRVSQPRQRFDWFEGGHLLQPCIGVSKRANIRRCARRLYGFAAGYARFGRQVATGPGSIAVGSHHGPGNGWRCCRTAAAIHCRFSKARTGWYFNRDRRVATVRRRRSRNRWNDDLHRNSGQAAITSGSRKNTARKSSQMSIS